MTETSRKILAFFSSIKDGVYPALKRMTSKINVFPEVSRRIDAILDKTGNVKDTASDALYEIRRQIKDKVAGLDGIHDAEEFLGLGSVHGERLNDLDGVLLCLV